MKNPNLLLGLLAVAGIFACNVPAGAAPTIDLSATLGASTATPLPPGVPSPTSTSVPCNQVSFVADVTIPDDTQIKVNDGFTKTWQLKNVGSCTWTSGYQVVFDSGDQMGGPATQQLTNATVAPNQTINVSINLVAPGSPGTYRGNWKMREPGGSTFALSTGAFWVQIKAINAAPPPQAEWPTFKQGDSGAEVFAIQYLLKARNYVLNPDGAFGPITQSRVEDFQTDNNLSEDGIVGPVTWPALIIQVKSGKHGPAVSAVQKLLKDKFGYNIAADGDFGPATLNAVKDFQTQHGLSVDGIVGPETWKALIK